MEMEAGRRPSDCECRLHAFRHETLTDGVTVGEP